MISALSQILANLDAYQNMYSTESNLKKKKEIRLSIIRISYKSNGKAKYSFLEYILSKGGILIKPTGKSGNYCKQFMDNRIN